MNAMRLSVSSILLFMGLAAGQMNAFAAPRAPGGPGNGGGFQKCWDKCVDKYLDCQLDNPEGSLEHALCDQRFDRCAQWCDLIHSRSGAVHRLGDADGQELELGSN